MMTTQDRNASPRSPQARESLKQVTLEQLVDLVTDCGVVAVESRDLAEQLLQRGFVMNEDVEDKRTLVLHKAQHAPEQNDLERMQSLVVDAYAPYSPKSNKSHHPFAQDLVRHARISAPQQIIMQSPSEPEFMRTTEDLVTHDKYEQEVYADVRFRAAYTRLVGSPRLELHLMVEEVQFGVSQSVNDKHTRGHFVYCIEIKVSPSEKWAHLCSQTSAKPSETYCLQRHSTLGISERLSKLSLPELNEIPEATVNSPNMDVAELKGNLEDSSASADVVKHRWLPATFDPKSSEKSVEWAWKMVTWDDGQPFHEDNPTICSWKSIPELPYKNPEVVRFKDLEDVNEATWEVSTDVVKALNGRLDWTFEIRIYTASVQQMQVRVGEDVVTYRKKAQRVAAKFKGKTSRSNALIIPPPS